MIFQNFVQNSLKGKAIAGDFPLDGFLHCPPKRSGNMHVVQERQLIFSGVMKRIKVL